MQIGDYLIPAPPVETMAWVPHAPEVKVEGFDDAAEWRVGSGQDQRGHAQSRQSGTAEVGHVLAVYKSAETFANPRYRNIR